MVRKTKNVLDCRLEKDMKNLDFQVEAVEIEMNEEEGFMWTTTGPG